MEVDCTLEHLSKSYSLLAHPQHSLHPTIVFVHSQPALSHKEPFVHGLWAHLYANEMTLNHKL